MQALTFHTDDFFSSIDHVISNLYKRLCKKKKKEWKKQKTPEKSDVASYKLQSILRVLSHQPSRK